MELVFGILAVYGATVGIMLTPQVIEQNKLKKTFNKLLHEKV